MSHKPRCITYDTQPKQCPMLR